MNKEKQIVEMAKEIDKTFTYAKMYYPDKYEPFELDVYPDEIARHLVNQNYRKINENEIVISKEEYERIWKNGYEEGYAILLDDTIKKTRKETAEKFVYLLTNNGERQTLPIKDNNDTVVDKAYVIPQSFLNQVAKQYGVDWEDKI